jgi:hypothetical protein
MTTTTRRRRIPKQKASRRASEAFCLGIRRRRVVVVMRGTGHAHLSPTAEFTTLALMYVECLFLCMPPLQFPTTERRPCVGAPWPQAAASLRGRAPGSIGRGGDVVDLTALTVAVLALGAPWLEAAASLGGRALSVEAGDVSLFRLCNAKLSTDTGAATFEFPLFNTEFSPGFWPLLSAS